ncbi:MAG: hypothetical protein ACK4GW_14050, partial [Pseudorhodobacter sp.]
QRGLLFGRSGKNGFHPAALGLHHSILVCRVRSETLPEPSLLGVNFTLHCGGSTAIIRIFREFSANRRRQLWQAGPGRGCARAALFSWRLRQQFQRLPWDCFRFSRQTGAG